MAAERRATPAATQQWRRSFMFGYAEQIRSMLKATADEAVQRVHPSSAALPALRARDKRVDEYSRQQFGRVVAARRPKPATVDRVGGRQARRQPGRPRPGPPAGGPGDRQRAMTADDGTGARSTPPRSPPSRAPATRSLAAFDELVALAAHDHLGGAGGRMATIAVVPARADAGSSSARQRGGRAPDRAARRPPDDAGDAGARIRPRARRCRARATARCSGARTSTWSATCSARPRRRWLLDAYAAMHLSPGHTRLAAAASIVTAAPARWRCDR